MVTSTTLHSGPSTLTAKIVVVSLVALDKAASSWKPSIYSLVKLAHISDFHSAAMSVETEEGWFSPDPTTRLYTKTWRPPSGTELTARLAFVHGFSDHCNNYYNLFPSLATRGIAVYAFDQRGWGRSALERSQRGDSGHTDTVLADIRSFLNHIASQAASHGDTRDPASTPLFLMGHSMGGAEVLLLSLLQSQPQPLPKISGILVGSPWISLHPTAQPSGFTVVAGKLASKVLPKRRLIQKLDPKTICRDQQVCRDYEKDDLCHDTGTLQGLAGALQRAADLTTLSKGQPVHGMGLKNGLGIDHPESETVPIWIGHGTDDRITSCASSQAIFEKLDVEDKTLKLYEGAFHKLHAEPDGVAEEFANDVANWILARTNNGRQEDGGATEMRSKL